VGPARSISLSIASAARDAERRIDEGSVGAVDADSDHCAGFVLLQRNRRPSRQLHGVQRVRRLERARLQIDDLGDGVCREDDRVTVLDPLLGRVDDFLAVQKDAYAARDAERRIDEGSVGAVDADSDHCAGFVYRTVGRCDRNLQGATRREGAHCRLRVGLLHGAVERALRGLLLCLRRA
jgi:hypothetical protein